jgi:hypothetical protein
VTGAGSKAARAYIDAEGVRELLLLGGGEKGEHLQDYRKGQDKKSRCKKIALGRNQWMFARLCTTSENSIADHVQHTSTTQQLHAAETTFRPT